jgi:tetratricopeptide (TPR) repeat protein
MRVRVWAAATALVAVVVPAAAQPDAARATFVDALGRFCLAVDGRVGDEGPAALAALDDMQRALDAWDALIRSYEAARDAERAGAPPALAARMHRALGGVYLDRGRLTDAIRELVAARTIEPAAVETHALLALAYARAGNRTGALTAARRVAASNPVDPIRLYLAGRELDRAGDPGGERLLRAFVAAEHTAAATPFIEPGLVPERTGVEPYVPLVPYAAGFTLLHKGDYRAAIAQFRTAAAKDALVAPRADGGALLRAAAAAVRAGDAGEARRTLTDLLAREPDRGDARRLLGFVAAADGDVDGALAALRQAIAQQPADERAHVALADALVEAGRLPDAEAALAAALAAVPVSGRARYLRGRLHQRLGRYAEAAADLEAVAALQPLLGLNGVLETLGDLASARQDFAAAAAAYQRRIDVQPNDAAAHADLGRAFMRLNRHPQALAEFAVAVMIDPGDAGSHTAIAQVRLRDGELAAAAQAARAALAVEATSMEARYVLATALIRGGHDSDGRRELARYQQLQAEDTAARERVFEEERLKREAAVAAASGDRETAIARLRRVAELSPRSGVAQLELGTALAGAGRVAEAADVLRLAIVLGAPSDARARLAAAYAALGREDEARRERSEYERQKAAALRARAGR